MTKPVALFLIVSTVWLNCLAQKAPRKSAQKPAAPVYKNLTLANLKTLGEAGDLAAQNEVGLVYALAQKGQKQDYEEAFKWFRMAAEKGLASAQYNLGSLYFYGTGVPKDYEEARRWYRNAADQGYIPAQYFLGWMYGNGKGVAESYKESTQWFRKAAEQGDSEAQYSLGLMYLRGEDLNPDYIEAYKWINLAAAQGNTNAVKARGKLAVSMTPEQIAEGQRRASQFSKSPSSATGQKSPPDAARQRTTVK